MNSEKLLGAIKHEVEKSNRQKKCLVEFQLHPRDEKVNKFRNGVCCLDIDVEIDEVSEKLKKLNGAGFDVVISHHSNLDDFLKNNKIKDQKNASPENNWRARLFTYSTVKDKNYLEFETFALYSFWRIIVDSDKDGRYYPHHDLFPYFWSPGWSAPGLPDPINAFTDEFELVERRLKSGHIDLTLDFLKVFVRKVPGTYTTLQFEDTNGAKEDRILLTEARVNYQNILKAYKSFFGIV